jgi:hypothetical protein
MTSLMVRVRAGTEAFTFLSARYYGNAKSMKKSTPKKPGRPFSGGRDPQIITRMPAELIKRIDRWAHINGVSRSEAVRRLITHSLPD